MKILEIPSWYPPNGGWFFKEHAIALAAQGLQVDVLAGINTGIRDNYPLQRTTRQTMKVCRQDHIREYIRSYPVFPFSEKLNYQSWVRTMLSFYDQYIRDCGHPDIIQVHSSLWAGVVASQVYKRYKVPYVITEHRSRFVYNTREARKLFSPWYNGPLEEAFKLASAIVTVSDSLHPKIIDLYARAAEKLSVIHNMVDCDFFVPPVVQSPLAKVFRLFSLASMRPSKGLDTLLHAMYYLEKEMFGEFELYIGGEGRERKHLEKFAINHGLEGSVKFLGMLNRQQVLHEMQKADLFVLPSRFEAFGVPFIEAMATGLPVIAGRSGGPESFIIPETGRIVEPDQPELLATAIIEMRRNHQQYSPSLIRNYAVENFAREKIAQQYIDLYNSIINK